NTTDSFFATDYIQVDTNVTENLQLELAQLDQWDCMFLHYLGVDHIGHSYGGIKSALMRPKLLEMDAVIKLIYQALKHQPEDYLLVITGDHGMTDQGNHGGSTDSESDTGTIFISTKLDASSLSPSLSKNKQQQQSNPIRIRQSDISVMVSAFLGLSIPSKSKGKLNLPLFDFMTSHKNAQLASNVKLCYQYHSARQHLQMNTKLGLRYWPIFATAVELHAQALQSCSDCCYKAYSNYDQYVDIFQ